MLFPRLLAALVVAASGWVGAPAAGAFVLGVDGTARALTHGHGAAMTVL